MQQQIIPNQRLTPKIAVVETHDLDKMIEFSDLFKQIRLTSHFRPNEARPLVEERQVIELPNLHIDGEEKEAAAILITGIVNAVSRLSDLLGVEYNVIIAQENERRKARANDSE